MSGAQTSSSMSPKLLEVAERARRQPQARFNSLAHLIDVPALARAYGRMRKDAAVGVDGFTKEAYGQDLQLRLHDLHTRLKSMKYRHQSIRRVHIPKSQGKTRPIGISAFEDKLVQEAVREVLEAVYEQDFLDCLYGFRPGRSAHDAIRRLDHIVHRGEVSWILEVDFLGFTLYWARARTGRWGMWCKTRRASLRRSIKAVYDWCRSHRHLPIQAQREALERRVRGHYNYFGVSGNFRCLLLFAEAVRRVWHKWLRRRSQRTRLIWERYAALLRTRWKLPPPRIAVRTWGA